jgi:nucleoside-diphosphate-sugar epimerase
MNYNIGLLGSSGFLGSDILKYFIQKNKKIFVYNRRKNKKKKYSKNINLYYGNFKDNNFNSFLKKIDILIFCISEISNKKKMYDVNVKLLGNIVEKLRGKKIKRFIYLSSVAVYKNKSEGVIKETNKDFSETIYSSTKLKAENIVIKNSFLNNYTPIILRPATIIGKDMPNKSIVQLISLIKKGIFFYFGNQESFLNYLYVRDLSKIVYFFSTYKKKPKYIIYNISNFIKLKYFVKSVHKYYKLENKVYINLPYIFTKILSFIGLLFNKFPLTPNRMSALSIKHRYCTRRLGELLDLNKFNNINKGFLEVMSNIKKY